MGKTVYLHVPDDMHEWLKDQAEAEDRSINNMIVRLLQQVRRGAGH